MRISSVCGLLLIAATPIRAENLSWSHDARLALNWAPVKGMVESLVGQTRFEGRLDTGSPLCSHYDVEVYADPERTALKDLSTVQWETPGASFCARLETQLNAHLHVDNCPDIDPSIGCKISACTSASRDVIPMAGSCGLGLLPPIRMSVDFMLPFKPTGAIVLDFTSATPPAPGRPGMSLTFGRFDGDEFVEEGSKRTVALSGRALGIGGRAASDYDKDAPGVSNMTRLNASLVLDYKAGAMDFAVVPSPEDVLADLGRDVPLKADELVGLSIAPSLFSRRYDDGSASGLFGEALPLRVRYLTRLDENKFIGIEVFVTGAGVHFQEKKGAVSGSVQFESSAPMEVWLEDKAGRRLASLAVAAWKLEATLRPDIREGGLGLTLDALALAVKLDKKLPELRTCVLTAVLSDYLDSKQKRLILGELASNIEVSTPDCIPGEGRIHSRRVCDDGQQDGYLSNAVQGGVKLKLALDVAHPVFRVQEGRLVVAIGSRQTIRAEPGQRSMIESLGQ